MPLLSLKNHSICYGLVSQIQCIALLHYKRCMDIITSLNPSQLHEKGMLPKPAAFLKQESSLAQELDHIPRSTPSHSQSDLNVKKNPLPAPLETEN